MSRIRICLAASLVMIVSSAAARGEDKPATPPKPVSYYQSVRPIIEARCQGCHQPAKKSGGLVMTSFETILKGGESQAPGFVAGKPEESEIYKQVISEGGKPPLMPKGGDPLTAEQIDLFRRWIAEGAVNDTPAVAEVVVDVDHPPVYEASPVLSSLDYSPDGSLLAVSGYHEVVLHNANAPDMGAASIVGRLVGQAERIESARFSPDGKLIAVTGGSPSRFGELQVWNVAEKTLVISVPVTYDTIYGAGWSSDNTRVAFGCADNTVRAIDITSGKQVLFQGAHNDWVLDTVFSIDDSHVVSVSRDRSMKLTEVATQRFVDNITSITPGALKGGLMAVDRHPKKDELLIGGSDGAPKIYQMYRTKARQIGDDFNLIRAFDAMPGRIFAVAYSHDGSFIVAASSNEGKGEVRVYNEADGKQISRFGDQFGPVYSIAVRPNGQEVAVAGFDGQVRIYNPQDGKLIREFTPVIVSPAPVAGISK